MRRGTAGIIVGLSVAVGAAVAVGARRSGRAGGPGEPVPDESAMFTVFAPGGAQGFWCNGPVGWLTARLMPITEVTVYRRVARLLELQPDDVLLDIGCGPGGFLAAQAGGASRVVGLDVSPLMLRAASRRLARRLAAGTAELVRASAAQLPFDDGTFTAATAIYAPASPSEVYRVLRPGGRFVLADPQPARTPEGGSIAYGVRRLGESDYRRVLGDAGFTDLAIHKGRGGLFALGRKP